MKPQLLSILACPSCGADLTLGSEPKTVEGEISSGELFCSGCASTWPIVNGIPRFVPHANYASSFGYQWNRFRTEQIDSESAITQSERRLRTETGWPDDWWKGKWVLDAGCGAGRFLEVASRAGSNVVGLDISSAIDAAAYTLRGRPNVHFVQASIFSLPFKSRCFDACYCIGVIQHTPDPLRAVASLPRVVQANGKIALTIYERRRFTMVNAKYLVRPITRRMRPTSLLWAIRLAMPVLWPLTEVLFRLPLVGRFFSFVIPIANYVGDPELSWRQRYQWAVMDTFDMLSPRYDLPQQEQAVRNVLSQSAVEDVTRLPNRGLNLVGRKV